MKCRNTSKSKEINQCSYCSYADMSVLKSDSDDIKKLRKLKADLIKKIIKIEERLLNPKKLQK